MEEEEFHTAPVIYLMQLMCYIPITVLVGVPHGYSNRYLTQALLQSLIMSRDLFKCITQARPGLAHWREETGILQGTVL